MGGVFVTGFHAITGLSGMVKLRNELSIFVAPFSGTYPLAIPLFASSSFASSAACNPVTVDIACVPVVACFELQHFYHPQRLHEH